MDKNVIKLFLLLNFIKLDIVSYSYKQGSMLDDIYKSKKIEKISPENIEKVIFPDELDEEKDC